MKIVNETRYSTRDLGAIASEAARRVVKTEGPLKVREMRFTRTRSMTMWNERSGRLTIGFKGQHPTAASVAHRVLSGIWFASGRKSQMDVGEYAWGATMTLDMKQKKPAARKIDVRAKRLRLAVGARDRWNTKAKRAATALKKLNTQIKRLTKTLERDGVL